MTCTIISRDHSVTGFVHLLSSRFVVSPSHVLLETIDTMQYAISFREQFCTLIITRITHEFGAYNAPMFAFFLAVP